jgi:outer membrane protein assembly factor BamB
MHRSAPRPRPLRARAAALALTLATPALVHAAPAAPAVDPATTWPQFRGLRRDGTVAPTGLATAWPASGPRERWRRAAGSGFSTVVSDGARAYTAAAEGSEEVVFALDLRTGTPVWRTVVAEPAKTEFEVGPRSTPTLDGGRLNAVSSGSLLVALDAASGRVLWQQDLTRFEKVPRFGYAISPVVADGLVIVDVGTQDLVDAAAAAAVAAGTAPPTTSADPAEHGESAAVPKPEVPPPPPPVGSIAAFDAATGELRWRGGFAGPVGYSSPLVAEIGGVRQLVYSRGTHVSGLGLDGKVLWRHETAPRAAIAMAVPLAADVFFVSASDDSAGGLAIRVRRDAAGGPASAWTTEEVWSERLMRNHFNTSVRVGDGLFGFDNATFRCLDARTGERRWAQRGFGKGSLLAAGELLYVLADDGAVALVQATCDEHRGYRELGRVQATTGKAWTSPSLAGGTLLVRDHDELVAYDVTAAGVAGAAAGVAAADAAGASGAGRTGASAAPAAPRPASATPADVAAAERALAAAATLDVDAILARHAAARGGRERWRAAQRLTLRGIYRAFSETSPFTLERQRRADRSDRRLGDLYRL